MLRIDRHIEILLLENDCVIVPGLGGFVAHQEPAQYDEKDAIFLPPYRSLGFNPLLTLNDSLLAQSYADVYDVSYPEAMQLIEQDVEAILKEIELHGKIELSGLGRLSKTNEGHFHFEPYDGGVLSPFYYGLSSYDFLPLQLQKKEEKEAVPENLSAVLSNKTISITTAPSGERHLNISLRAIRRVAVAAVVVFFISVLGLNVQERHRVGDEPIKSGVLYNLFDSGKNATESTVVVTSQEQEKQEIANATAHYWTIVLASHITETNAEEFVKKLHEEGFKDAHSLLKKGSVKVVSGYYASAQGAVEQLNKLRSNTYFEQAWVLEVK